jgi:hypothetical protein
VHVWPRGELHLLLDRTENQQLRSSDLGKQLNNPNDDKTCHHRKNVQSLTSVT